MVNDVISICETCGKPTLRRLHTDLLPEGHIDVRVMCSCDIAAEEALQAEKEKTERLVLIERLRVQSMLEGDYLHARFETYEQRPENEEARRRALQYVEDFDNMRKQGRGLLFYGPVGTGKTYTAACIANELIDRCVPVAVTSFVSFLQQIQNDMPKEAELMANMRRADLVILDDLGAVRSTDYGVEKVFNLIENLTRISKPLIITTNLALTTLRDEPDIRKKRGYDRILERCFPVLVGGRSRRIESAARVYDEMTSRQQDAATGSREGE